MNDLRNQITNKTSVLTPQHINESSQEQFLHQVAGQNVLKEQPKESQNVNEILENIIKVLQNADSNSEDQQTQGRVNMPLVELPKP